MVREHYSRAFSLPENALKQRGSLYLQSERINSPRDTGSADIALLVGTTKQAAGTPARDKAHATLRLQLIL